MFYIILNITLYTKPNKLGTTSFGSMILEIWILQN
jgi:hypothetical protein